MIVLDEDRGKPIHIRQSLFFPLVATAAIGVIATIAALEIARKVGKDRASTVDPSSVETIIARSASVLIPVGLLTLFLVLLARRRCFWSVAVDDAVINYRSVLRDTSVQVADIVRVSSERRRLTWYNVYMKDGSSIRMFDVANDSMGDLARFEDDVVCKIPQVVMKRRLFSKIVKRDRTEYL